MNEITKAVEATAIVPATMHDAMELAKMMANSSLVPREFQRVYAKDQAAPNCLLVIMQAIRWQMDPFAVIQHTSIIQNKPMYNGQLVAAVVNSRANLKQPLDYVYGDDKEGRFVVVSAQRACDDKPKSVRVDLKKVRTQNAQWDKQPDQQLAYHGTRVWARRWTPELMLGVYSPEEFGSEPRKRVPAEEVTNAILHDEDGVIADEDEDAPGKNEYICRLSDAADKGIEFLESYGRTLNGTLDHLSQDEQEEVREEYKRLHNELLFAKSTT